MGYDVVSHDRRGRVRAEKFAPGRHRRGNVFGRFHSQHIVRVGTEFPQKKAIIRPDLDYQVILPRRHAPLDLVRVLLEVLPEGWIGRGEIYIAPENVPPIHIGPQLNMPAPFAYVYVQRIEILVLVRTYKK